MRHAWEERVARRTCSVTAQLLLVATVLKLRLAAVPILAALVSVVRSSPHQPRREFDTDNYTAAEFKCLIRLRKKY